MKKSVFIMFVAIVAMMVSFCNKNETPNPAPVAINDTIVVNDNPETAPGQVLLPGQLNVNVMTLNLTPKCDVTLKSLITQIEPVNGTPGYKDISMLAIFNEGIQIGSTVPVSSPSVTNDNLNFQMRKDVKYSFTFVINVSTTAVPSSLLQLSFGGLAATDKNGKQVTSFGGTGGNIFTIKAP